MKTKKAFQLFIPTSVAIMTMTAFISIFGYSPVLSVQNSVATQLSVKITSSDPLIVNGVTIPDMQMITQNDKLILYANLKNASVAVRQRNTDNVWYSNPINIEKDKLAKGSSKFRLMSQLDIVAFDVQGQKKSYDNYTSSINKKQFVSEKTANGIKFIFTFGNKKQVDVEVPKQITDIRFNDKFTNNPSLSIEEKDWIKSQFRYDDTDKVWSWKSTSSEILLSKIKSIFQKAGYTNEDYLKDSEKDKPQEVNESEISIDIPVIYEIEEDSFVARIPLKELKIPTKWYLTNLSLLENFGAAFEEEQGYVFVPDGSGALIKYNKNIVSKDNLYIPLYGNDKSMDIREKKDFSKQAVMPIFGMKTGNQGFLAIIEDSDAFASINASRSGYLNSFNTAFSSYNLTSKGYIRLGDGNLQTQVSAYQKKMYDGEIKVRYLLLTGDNSDFSGMANAYRNYLTSRNGLKQLIPKENIPFILETVGSIVKTKYFLGFSYVGNYPLTTFEQNRSLLDKLLLSGVGNIKLRLTGWFNGGLDQDLATRISPISQLGGNKEFKELINSCKLNGIELYPDVKFQTANNRKGFSIYNSAAKVIDQRFSKDYKYTCDTNLAMDYINPLVRGYQYVVSPRAIGSVVDKFLNKFKGYNLNTLSLSDFGEKLNSDYSEENTIDRQKSLQIIRKELVKTSKSVQKVMITGGNAYAMPFSDIVVNAPMDYSGFNITDESIPFFQMVYHGLIEYCGDPLNFSSSYKKDILKAVENGGAIYYKWGYEDSTKTKYTSDDNLYSIYYGSKYDDAVNVYKKANNVLKGLQDVSISGYEKKDNVSFVSYENGDKIVVNYNKEPVTVYGITVAGEDFNIVKGTS
jgi:hypothetical protein